MLVTDTNILVRCVMGKAFMHVSALIARDVVLATTDRNVDESIKVLSTKLGLDPASAISATMRVLRPFEVIDSVVYLSWQASALARLREGGKADWPVLAAALAMHCDIWSEDVDFFGTGVAIWSTGNVRHYTRSEGSISG